MIFLKCRLGFCKVLVKIFCSLLRLMRHCAPPPSASRRNTDCMSPTLRASPWGEVPSLSRRRGDSLTFRYLHFYRLHTSLYLNTSSIQLNSYAYKLQSPLSRPSGASSPQGEPLLSLTSIHLVYTQKTYLILIPIQSAKAPATFPPGEVAANHSKNSTPNTLNKRPSRCAHHRQPAHC